MENYLPWTPPVQELTPEDKEAMQTSLAEMNAIFEASRDELRTKLAMERAQVSSEEWETMNPLLKSMYTQSAVEAYNHNLASKPRDGLEEYSVFL